MTLRTELEELPGRMRGLPVDERGYPVPWFVAWVNGKPEFRAMDPEKWRLATNKRRCWVCGEKLGVFLTFVIGPMCGINRITSEPACHRECARWSARNCPFLSRPHMVRREGGMEGAKEAIGGIMIPRNPGVTLLWTTRDFQKFRDGMGGVLIRVGEPTSVEWWFEGRPATRAEVEHSVETGFPALLELAEKEGPEAVAELHRAARRAKELYPEAA